jgi:uncharacterized protein YjiS (DUF1127 family)
MPSAPGAARPVFADFARPAHQTGLRWFVRLLSFWCQRSAQRAALLELDDDLLQDIGKSRPEAKAEAAKSFWRD